MQARRPDNGVSKVLGDNMTRETSKRINSSTAEEPQRRFAGGVVFALGFGLAASVGSRIAFQKIDSTYQWNYLSDMDVKSLLIFIGATLLFFVSERALLLWSRRRAVATIPGNQQHVWHVPALAAVLLVAWLPYMLALYPGVVLPDTISSIDQIVGAAPLSNHHPILFTLTLKLFIMMLGGNISHGIFLFAIFQSLVLAFTLSFSLEWARLHGARRWMCNTVILFYALVPAFPIYGMNIQKDTLFACWVLLSGIFAFEVDRQIQNGELHKGQCLLLSAMLTLVWFSRNNGPYVSAGIMVWLGLVALRHGRPKAFLFSVVPSLAACLLVVGPIFSAISVPTEDAESVGIPLQQLAATVVYSGDIDATDMEYLGNLLPVENYRKYTPCLADTLKWDASFNNDFLRSTKANFLQVWARVGLRNIGIYEQAYVMETYGFWVPGVKNPYGFLDTRVQENEYGIVRIDLFQTLTGSNAASRIVESTTFFGSGTLLWALLLLVAVQIDSRKTLDFALLLPAVLVVLTILIATPVAFSLRYVFVLAIGISIYCLREFADDIADERASRAQ